jgi:WhiB family redox-sensing transcriptional regulator
VKARSTLEFSPGAAGPALAAAGHEDLSWQDLARCQYTDPEAFYPEKGESTRAAKAVCRACEVRAECLEYALAHGERFGVWGGYSEHERRRIRRQRELGAAA